MRIHRLVSLVARGVWFIEPSVAADYRELVENLLSGNPSAFWDDDEEQEDPSTLPFAMEVNAAGKTTGQRFSAYDEAPAGSIAVIPINGVMTPDDNCGAPGTTTLGQRLMQADAHPNIAATVLKFATPGGAVDGLEEFAGIIGSTTKPTVAHVTKAASAGYWSASQTNLVVVGGKTAGLGSIGTMATLRDYSKMDEARGITQHDITATASKNKNAAYYAALQGDYAPLRKETLDPLNNAFLEAVESRRGAKLPPKQKADVLSGSMFYGQAAIDAGLGDEMGDFNHAVRRAKELADAQARETPPTTTASSTSQTDMFNKFKAVASLAGLKGDALTAALMTAANENLVAEGVTGVQLITTDQLAELKALAQRTTDAEAKAKKAGDDFTDEANARQKAETDLQARDKELDAAKAEIKKLEALPGAKTSTAVRTDGKSDVEPGAATADEVIANLPSSKALDGHPLFG